jgi:hypothetical protein
MHTTMEYSSIKRKKIEVYKDFVFYGPCKDVICSRFFLIEFRNNNTFPSFLSCHELYVMDSNVTAVRLRRRLKIPLKIHNVISSNSNVVISNRWGGAETQKNSKREKINEASSAPPPNTTLNHRHHHQSRPEKHRRRCGGTFFQFEAPGSLFR